MKIRKKTVRKVQQNRTFRTAWANESFAEFANTLQKEIEDETGVKFGVLQLELFSGMVYEEKKTVEKTVTPEQAEKVIKALTMSGVITESGKVDTSINPEQITLPAELDEVKETVTSIKKNAEILVSETLTGTAYT